MILKILIIIKIKIIDIPANYEKIMVLTMGGSLDLESERLLKNLNLSRF